MENKSLYHAGVKGMKWGVRRYQNKDGSLTPAGRKRYERDLSTLSNNKKKNYTVNADKWVKEDLERTKGLTEASSRLTSDLKKVTDSSIRSTPKVKMDLSKMTDQQMRTEINRALLERQYNDMFAPQKSTKGREYASQILETAGSVLAVTGSALGIALSIKALKSGVV